MFSSSLKTRPKCEIYITNCFCNVIFFHIVKYLYFVHILRGQNNIVRVFQFYIVTNCGVKEHEQEFRHYFIKISRYYHTNAKYFDYQETFISRKIPYNYLILRNIQKILRKNIPNSIFPINI